MSLTWIYLDLFNKVFFFWIEQKTLVLLEKPILFVVLFSSGGFACYKKKKTKHFGRDFWSINSLIDSSSKFECARWWASQLLVPKVRIRVRRNPQADLDDHLPDPKWFLAKVFSTIMRGSEHQPVSIFWKFEVSKFRCFAPLGCKESFYIHRFHPLNGPWTQV